MRGYNLTFIGGNSSWAGTTVSFWGKFNEGPEARHFSRENLIEAIPISFDNPSGKPSEEHFFCSAFLTVPDEYLYEEDG